LQIIYAIVIVVHVGYTGKMAGRPT